MREVVDRLIEGPPNQGFKEQNKELEEEESRRLMECPLAIEWERKENGDEKKVNPPCVQKGNFNA
jgi:hypothetical protein